MLITYFGHSCFSISLKNKMLLFDPFISGNPLAGKIDIDNIKTDYVLISHGHSDHIIDAERIINNNNAKLIANYEIVTYLGNKIKLEGHPLNTGGKYKFDFGTVRYVHAEHSSMMPDGSYGGSPGGFIINTDEVNFYFAGDSGLSNEMKLIGEYYPLDFSFLPLGDNFTMGVDDAIIASDFIKCNRIIGMHYNSFPIISIDEEQVKQKFKKAGKELILFNIGESKNIF